MAGAVTRWAAGALSPVGCSSTTQAKATNPASRIASAAFIFHGLICRIAALDNGAGQQRQRDMASETASEHLLQGNDAKQNSQARGDEQKVEPSRHMVKRYAKCGQYMAGTNAKR